MDRISVSRRSLLRSLGAGAGLAAAGALTRSVRPAAAADKVKLTVLTHWSTQSQKDVIDPIFKQYSQVNPNVEIVHQAVDFNDLLNRITTGRLGGGAPDIYHFYNLWMADFVGSDLLSSPPADALAAIKEAYSAGTVGGASYKGQPWGYPTEVDVYQLMYLKSAFKEAGITKAPATWDELKDAAQKTTKKDAKGKVTRPGFLLLKDWDSGVVHPFTSLLWSNGGEYAAEDYSKVLFNEQPGVEAVQLEDDLVKMGAADLSFVQTDWEAGKAAMTILANWEGATLRKSIPGGIEDIGVAPIPYTPGHSSVALQYEWLWGVDKNSQHAKEAWDFLSWLNSPSATYKGSSPMGVFLTTGLNAIPGRTSDQQVHADILNDPFVKPFVDALKTSRTEPIIPGAQEIKTSLQKQIEASWYGQKSAKDALDTAATDGDRILKEKG